MHTTWMQSALHKYALNRLISPLLGLGVTITLVIYLVRQIDYPHFLHLAKSVPLWLFFLLFVLFFLLNIFRALRFRMLLDREQLPLTVLFPITLCHNFLVRTLPLMVGEFSYIALLRRHLKIPVSEGVRSLFEARLFDLQFVILGGTFGFLTMRGQSTGYVLSLLVVIGVLISANHVFFSVLPKGIERIWTCIIRICPWRHSALLDSVGHKLGEVSLQLQQISPSSGVVKSPCTFSLHLWHQPKYPSFPSINSKC